MAQESAFFAALIAVARYEISDDSLRLLDAAEVPLIGLIRTKE
jgi:putative lipoprotein